MSLGNKRAKMKPVHIDFIDLIEEKIKPELKRQRERETFVDGSKVVADIMRQVDLEDVFNQPKIILFGKKGRKKR